MLRIPFVGQIFALILLLILLPLVLIIILLGFCIWLICIPVNILCRCFCGPALDAEAARQRAAFGPDGAYTAPGQQPPPGATNV